MARRARFGRLPRSAPSLTATIVSLAQEYQRVRDTNIEEAWKGGGLFEGKKVTDDQMLKYWTERRDGVSKDDPMWDYYNNQLHAFQFNIAETKAYLDYKQKDISEGEMAAFYEKWARKMPQNSANYRMLMTKAAEFRDAAARGSASSDYAAREARYQKNQNATWEKYEKPWDQFESSIMEYMVMNQHVKRSDIDTSNNGGWAAFNDPALLNNFLFRLNNDPSMAQGKADLIKAMDDPNFSGNFTEADIDRLIRRKQTGLGIEKTRAVKSGNHDADVTRLGREQGMADAASVSIGTAAFQEIADRRGRELNNILADPTAQPSEVAAAIRENRDWFATEGKRMVEDELPSGFDPLSGKPHNQFAVDLMGQVEGTIAALDGKPRDSSIWDDPYGNLPGGQATMAAKVGEQASIVLQQDEDLRSGKAVLMGIGGDKKGKAGNKPEGWAVVPLGDPRLSGRDVFIMPSSTTGVRQAYIGAPITIEAYKGMDPNTREGVGEKVQLNRDETQGYTVAFDTGGGTAPTTLYGIYVDGELRWSHVSPIPVTATSKTDIDEATGAIRITGLTGNAKPNPDDWIDRAGLMTGKTGADGSTFVIGSQASILQARMRASDVDARRISNMPDEDYIQQEAEYYTAHPTKTMQNARAAGGEQGFQAALGNEIRLSVNNKQTIRFYGPETDRERVLNAMQSRAEAERAANMERRAIDDAPLRAGLVRDVESWQIDARKSGDVYYPSSLTANDIDPQTGLPSLSGIPGGSNWTLQKLLTSPQISTQHAQSIAAYLTRGGVAGAGPTTIPERTGEVPVFDSTFFGQSMFRSMSPRINAALGPVRTRTVTTPTQVVNAPPPAVPSAVPSPTPTTIKQEPFVTPQATTGYTGVSKPTSLTQGGSAGKRGNIAL